MKDLRSGIEHLKQAKAHMSKANGIMSNHISKLKELEEENAALKAELDDWKSNAEGFEPDAYMKLPLDADGAVIHVDDFVYFEGNTGKVLSLCWNGAYWEVGLFGYPEYIAVEDCHVAPKSLHSGADGAPIEVGDTVYCDDDPEPLKVVSMHGDNGGYCTVGLEDSMGILMSVDAPRLSHKKPDPPDSWEKLEEDISLSIDDYWTDVLGREYTFCIGDKVTAKASDIVLRAKKLAGIEEEAER